MKMSSVTIVGRIAQDPNLTKTNSGKSFLNVTIAENKKDETCWHKVQFFDKAAEIHAEKLQKGMEVTLLGANMYQKQYDTKEGFKVNETIFVGGDLVWHPKEKTVVRAS